jgi:transcriptional regulator with XRE-family HTH domain
MENEMQSTARKPLSSLGERLTAVRVAKNMNLAEAAKIVGTSKQSFSGWQTGRTKPKDVNQLYRFCEATETDLTWLVEGKGEPPRFLYGKHVANFEDIVQDTRQVTVIATKRPVTGMVPVSELLDSRGNVSVPQISGHLAEHAKGLSTEMPLAGWSIPVETILVSFHCIADHCVMMRVTQTDREFQRGDYLLLDTSRNRLDEPGTYLVSDGETVFRAAAEFDQAKGKMRIVRLDNGEAIEAETAMARVMAVMSAL